MTLLSGMRTHGIDSMRRDLKPTAAIASHSSGMIEWAVPNLSPFANRSHDPEAHTPIHRSALRQPCWTSARVQGAFPALSLTTCGPVWCATCGTPRNPSANPADRSYPATFPLWSPSRGTAAPGFPKSSTATPARFPPRSEAAAPGFPSCCTAATPGFPPRSASSGWRAVTPCPGLLPSHRCAPEGGQPQTDRSFRTDHPDSRGTGRWRNLYRQENPIQPRPRRHCRARGCSCRCRSGGAAACRYPRVVSGGRRQPA